MISSALILDSDSKAVLNGGITVSEKVELINANVTDTTNVSDVTNESYFRNLHKNVSFVSETFEENTTNDTYNCTNDSVVNNTSDINYTNISDSDVSNDTVSTSVETKSTSYSNSLVVYGYPSSWQDGMSYHLYKFTYDSNVLNKFYQNNKGTFEGEWTNKVTDNDFSYFGNHKDYFEPSCSSPKEYLINYELA
jgi:hypothetical protein